MMVKRILISPSACRMSAAGVDVTSSPPASELLFDLFNDHYCGVYVAGMVAWGASGWSVAHSSYYTANDTATYTYNLSFGKTFAGIPQLLWGVSSPYINSGQTFYPYYYPKDYSTGANAFGNWVITYANITTTGITFAISSTYGTLGTTPTARYEYRLNMIYAVFQV